MVVITVIMYLLTQKRERGGGSQSSAVSVKPLATSASPVMTVGRTQSVPAPDTSAWTRVDDGKHLFIDLILLCYSMVCSG